MVTWERVVATVKSIRRLLLVIMAILDAIETIAKNGDE